jgi:HK97 family phage prohead protease
MSEKKPEVRVFGKVELRAATADSKVSKIGGYAAVFNSPTDVGDFFTEIIAPGAFTNAIISDDVRALFNHDPNFVLGRKSNRTLSLSEDNRGLMFEASPPDTTWAKDLLASIDRGDISEMSFQFIAKREQWDDTGAMPIRTLLEVELLDVSVVTFPQYEDTSVATRSLTEWRSKQAPGVNATPLIAARMRMRQSLRDRDLLRV